MTRPRPENVKPWREPLPNRLTNEVPPIPICGITSDRHGAGLTAVWPFSKTPVQSPGAIAKGRQGIHSVASIRATVNNADECRRVATSTGTVMPERLAS